MQYIHLKKRLLDLCLEHVNERVYQARRAMEEAQQSANQEERSTAGDKYDTSRAMSQNLRDMNARQMNEALKDLSLLHQIRPDTKAEIAITGSLIQTSEGFYLLAVSLGLLKVDDIQCISISPAAPLGQLIIGKRRGDRFEFRGKSVEILEVF